MGKGVMPDDHPLSVAAARTLALQNAAVVFLMGAPAQLDLPPPLSREAGFGQPPRYAKDMKVIQLDIAAKRLATTIAPIST
ncbi:MAG: hypothetical protein ACJ8AH_12110 [Stellaceae bacterium]|jgi:2-hydroxyacyl-CoA lyase 1